MYIKVRHKDGNIGYINLCGITNIYTDYIECWNYAIRIDANAVIYIPTKYQDYVYDREKIEKDLDVFFSKVNGYTDFDRSQPLELPNMLDY